MEDLHRLLAQYANPPGVAARVTGPHAFTDIADPVTELRSRVYAAEMPHLLLKPMVEFERRLELDSRTTHFCTWTPEGELAGALRISDRPLELPELSVECSRIVDAHPLHSELTRVVIHPEHRRRDLPARLFAAMILYLLQETDTIGIMGICREGVVPFYEAFGLTIVNEEALAIAGRPHADYRVVAATYEHVIALGAERLLSVEGAEPSSA